MDIEQPAVPEHPEFQDLFDNAPVAYHELDRLGVIRRVNRAECALLGYDSEEMVGRPASEFVVAADREISREAVRRKLSGEQPLAIFDRRHIRRDGRELWLEVHDTLVRNAAGETTGIRTALLDITGRKRAEAYREMDRKVLQILNEPGGWQDAIRRVAAGLRTLTACDAVGLRLQDGDDFPFLAQEGFSENFLRTENTLIERGANGRACRDRDGNIRLQCGCGLVISGRPGPANSFVTPGGSLWVNCSTQLLHIPRSEDPRLHPRNRCIYHGYESVALIPIRGQDAIVGLIQFNSRTKGHFAIDSVELLEGIASHIGAALLRKRAEEALRQSEARLREAEQLAHVGSSSWDVESDTTVWSEELCRIAGRDPRGPAPSLAERAAIYTPESWARLREAMKTAVAMGEPYHLELDLVRPDGALRRTRAQGAPVRDDSGRIVRLMGTLQDITEQKQADEEKARLQAQLAQAQKMESIGRLAGGVAHDFNNLLTVINGYSRMLLARLNPGDPMQAQIAEIHTAGERAAALTRQLLAFSRKQVLEPRRLDLNHVVAEMRPMLERLIGDEIDLRFALSAGNAIVLADRHQLEQVVMNLAVNGRDAMPCGGRLLIETAAVERDRSFALSHPEARARRYVMLAVSDNGNGMEKETRERIFEPFFTTKPNGRGTGLGLSMVEGIVAQSGGHINVYSEPGHGATINVYLPAVDGEAAAAVKPAAVRAVGGNETVLVVEDRADVRRFAAEALQSYGYRVISAAGAGEALLLRERERIDLVLTDVVMPNVSGQELAERLAALQPGIKVLFMSGYAGNGIAQNKALKEGVEYIQKPFSPEELAGKVRTALGPPALPARILVADDESAVRGFLRQVLEGEGYQVTEAADGKQAFRQARAAPVDLAILDIVMPEQDGIETIQAFGRDLPGVGIIAISGGFGGQYLKVAQMLGADAVLGKPVCAERLLARVAEVLKSR